MYMWWNPKLKLHFYYIILNFYGPDPISNISFKKYFSSHCTKMKFSIKDFFSKCDQIRSFQSPQDKVKKMLDILIFWPLLIPLLETFSQYAGVTSIWFIIKKNLDHFYTFFVVCKDIMAVSRPDTFFMAILIWSLNFFCCSTDCAKNM